MQRQNMAENSGENAGQFWGNTLMYLILAVIKWSFRAMINVESRGSRWELFFSCLYRSDWLKLNYIYMTEGLKIQVFSGRPV